MKFLTKLIFLKLLVLLNLACYNISFADNHNIYETLEIIKNDIKTLERAVYSGSIEVKAENNETSNTELDSNSEDVLTRHLLKLSEVEDQFRQLTNKFEEINFKLDKLSNRLSKIQADNQIRFQDIESAISSREVTTVGVQVDLPESSADSLPEESEPLTLSIKDEISNSLTSSVLVDVFLVLNGMFYLYRHSNIEIGKLKDIINQKNQDALDDKNTLVQLATDNKVKDSQIIDKENKIRASQEEIYN